MSAAERALSVKRRAVLGVLALSLTGGCVDTWPGATGPRGPPDAPDDEPRDPEAVQIDGWDFGETDAGLLRVFGTVSNDGERSAAATVEITVRAGETEYQQTTTVDVPAESTAEFDVEFDVEHETFIEDGSIRLDLL